MKSVRFIAVLCAGTILAAVLSGSGAPTTSRLSFDRAQVARGRLEYIEHCAQCHSGDLSGYYGPALAGRDGNLQWQTPKQVWEYTLGQMPVGDSGGLPKAQYLDIMAYILSQHQVPAGHAPLTPAALEAEPETIGALRLKP